MKTFYLAGGEHGYLKRLMEGAEFYDADKRRLIPIRQNATLEDAIKHAKSVGVANPTYLLKVEILDGTALPVTNSGKPARTRKPKVAYAAVKAAMARAEWQSWDSVIISYLDTVYPNSTKADDAAWFNAISRCDAARRAIGCSDREPTEAEARQLLRKLR